MGYLLTENVWGGRWAYSKPVAYNNAAALHNSTAQGKGNGQDRWGG